MSSNATHPSPSWLDSSPAFLIDGYWPPLFPRIEYDARELLGRAQDLGCSVVRFPSVGKWATYPSAIMPPHPDLGGRDLVAETLAEADRRGMKVALYLSVGHALPQTLVREMRPHWGALLDDGVWPRPRQFFGGEGVLPIDTFGPYWADLLAMVDELLGRYEIDALYLDGPYFGWHFWEGLISQTEATRQVFETETGRPLPRNDDTASPDGKVFWAWAAQRLIRLFSEIRQRATARGNVPVLFNLCAGQVGTENIADDLIALGDGCLLERIMGGLKGFAKARRAETFVWQYASHHTYWPRFSSPDLERRTVFAAGETVRMGGRPIYANAGRFAYAFPPASEIAAAFQNVGVLSRRLARAQKVPHCHILSVDAPLTHGPAGGAQETVTALLEVLENAAIGAEVRLEDTFANPPPVLLVPSSLDPKLLPVALLEEYVVRGGLLVAFLGGPEAAELADLQELLSLRPFALAPDEEDRLHLHRFEDFAGVAGDVSRLQDGWHGYDLYLADGERRMPLGRVPVWQPDREVDVLASVVTGTDWKAVTPAVWTCERGLGRVVTVATDADFVCALTGDKIVSDFVSGLIRRYCPPIPALRFADNERSGTRATFFRDENDWSLVLADGFHEGSSPRILPEMAISLPEGTRILKVETTPPLPDLRVEIGTGSVILKGASLCGHLGVHLHCQNQNHVEAKR